MAPATISWHLIMTLCDRYSMKSRKTSIKISVSISISMAAAAFVLAWVSYYPAEIEEGGRRSAIRKTVVSFSNQEDRNKVPIFAGGGSAEVVDGTRNVWPSKLPLASILGTGGRENRIKWRTGIDATRAREDIAGWRTAGRLNDRGFRFKRRSVKIMKIPILVSTGAEFRAGETHWTRLEEKVNERITSTRPFSLIGNTIEV